MVEGMKHSTSCPDGSSRGWSGPVLDDRAPASGPVQVLRMSAVMAATGLSRTTLWRLRRTGEFPAPVRLGGDGSRAVGWLRNDIEAWIISRPAA